MCTILEGNMPIRPRAVCIALSFLFYAILTLTARAEWQFDDSPGADLVVYDRPSNSWFVKKLTRNGGQAIRSSFQFGFDGGIPLTGDFNGDEVEDVAVYDPDKGQWYISSIKGGSPIAWRLQWGFKGAIPLVGDFNKDGKDDIAVYDPNTSKWYARSLGGTVFAWERRWGFKEAVPVVLDVDGGGDDFGVYSDGRWFITQPNGEVVYWDRRWGFPGAIPVPADFDRDGRDEFAVYGSENNKWYAMKSNGLPVIFELAHGFAGASPVAKDFDGDGAADLGIFDPESGDWFIRKASGRNPVLAFRERHGSKNATPPGAVELEAYDIGVQGTGGGFVWKPISEGDHKLVVLLPPRYRGNVQGCYIADESGKPIENGRFSGDTHNGFRPHYRFSMKGAGYGRNIYVVAVLRNGNLNHWFIPNGAARVDY